MKAFLPVLEVWGVLMRLAIWPSSVFQEVKSCQFKVFCFVFSKYSPIHLDVLHRPGKKILLDILCLTVCSSYYACRSCPLWLLVGCRKHHPLSQWLSPKQAKIKTKIFKLYFVFHITAFNCNLNWILFWLFLLLPEVFPQSLCGSKPPCSLGQDGPSPL